MKSFFTVVTIIFLLSINSLANVFCACCSDKGYYSISYSAPTNYQTGELGGIKFEPEANLFMTEAGEDGIKGLLNPKDNYGVTGSFLKSKFTINLKDGAKSGTLTLPLPAKMVTFKVDTHETADEARDPVLYKEWRFEGAVTGNGIFQSGMAPATKYFLVLQGRGNYCDSIADFNYWRLEITGRKASYAFYGKLKNN